MSIQHLGTMTWREVKEFVWERTVALLPLGSIEAHGPHLPLNTDVMISAEMAKRASRKLSAAGKDVLIYPPVVFTPAGGGAKFAGTVNVATGAFAGYLRGILSQVATAGVKTAALVTCHVDEAYFAAVTQAREALDAAMGAGAFRIVAPDLRKEPWIELMPEEFRRGAGHAGHYETSCLLAIDPEKVREEVRKSLSPVEPSAPEGDFESRGAKDAYFGSPAGATSAHGEDYLEALATIVTDAILDGKGAA
jgi:creatinine amidohydrolase